MQRKSLDDLFEELGGQFLDEVRQQGLQASSDTAKLGAMMYLGFAKVAICVNNQNGEKGSNGMPKTWVALGTAIGAAVASAVTAVLRS